MKPHPKPVAAQISESIVLAYSYIRFSTPEQAKGDSLRRQMKAAADWCERNGAKLDTSTTLHDLGRSAFLGEHRKNPDRCALAAFLKLVEAGKVPRGSFLIVESLDRLSREHIRPALTLLLQLIEAGIRVVQLIPVEAIYDDKVEPMQLMMAIMELTRGHSESAVKSERIGSAWAEKRRAAAEGKPQPEKRTNRVNGMSILTHQLPAWVREKGGKLELIPDAANAVRRVYELARNGYGHSTIAKKFIADKVPAIGTSGEWARSYIARILATRITLGEYQPCKRDGTPEGEPIKNYFPAVVTEAEWLAARSAAASRKPGKTFIANGGGLLNNLFAGLITDARDGGSYYAAQRTDGYKPGRNGGSKWALINTRSAEGRAPCVSFPVEPFERGILSKLREIDPNELMDTTSAPSATATLAADLARVESDIAKLEAELEEGGDSIPAVIRVLGKKEARRKELADALAVAKAAEATPVSAAWGEYQTLVDVLDTATDRADARRRLRSALRRIVSGVWLLAVPRGRTRIAAVRVQFAGCEHHRDYLLVFNPVKANAKARTPAKLEVFAFGQRATLSANPDRPEETVCPHFDLRDREAAGRLAVVLGKYDGSIRQLADDAETPLDVKIWLDSVVYESR
jgi:DNA invertase Pin-like site-specific DNA recombinase